MNYDPNNVNAVLSRIESKLDAALATLKEHEGKISSLERARYWLLGAAAVVGYLIDYIIPKASSLHK